MTCRPVLGHFPICLMAHYLLSLLQLGGDWLQNTSVTATFLLFTTEDDGWLTESCISKFKPHISILLSPVSLLYILSVLTHLTCTEHSLSVSAHVFAARSRG